jgi:DNA-binding NtrC family response regulator
MDSELVAPHAVVSTPPSVLIVDQDFMARWQVADYLRERGYNTIEATGVPDAMSLLASGMHVDIVFHNAQRPDASESRLLAEWIEKHHPRLPLLVTSDTPVEAAVSAKGPTCRVIVEPYDLAQLAAHIDSILKGP